MCVGVRCVATVSEWCMYTLGSKGISMYSVLSPSHFSHERLISSGAGVKKGKIKLCIGRPQVGLNLRPLGSSVQPFI